MQQGSLPARTGRRLVRALDAYLCRKEGIFVFDEDPACILRLSLIRAPRAMSFANGALVAPGDQLAMIHLWNERLPLAPADGSGLQWARAIYRGLLVSLRLLARYLTERPALGTVRAIGSDAAGFLTGGSIAAGRDLFARMGFELQRPRATAHAWNRFVWFWENVYSWMLIWTYNPASLRGKPPWSLERVGLWMPRATLEERYGKPAESKAGPLTDAVAEGSPALTGEGMG